MKRRWVIILRHCKEFLNKSKSDYTPDVTQASIFRRRKDARFSVEDNGQEKCIRLNERQLEQIGE